MTACENHRPPFPRSDCSDLNAAQRKGGLVFLVLQPIGRPAVVSMETVFVFTSDRRRLSERRRAFDGIPPETDVHFRLRPTHLLNPRGRNQHLLTPTPNSCEHLNVADGPRFVVYEEARHMADLAVLSLNVIAGDSSSAAKMRIHRLSPDLFRQHILRSRDSIRQARRIGPGTP